ncbi:hypothetical protein QYF52_19245 [Paenibacillus polymyxa]|uniref:hypothetical protein n=1 Tax=Paenibacillus polymyxa TaxID=1406 RepID=UPI0025B6C605|nr:hypothetical protein [Paenibacillus polymyxa]MDN4080084.1 hypothetical protein [Paenibacillus polymyxa]MDN4105094.1 hypothetical protein [Paenibacillus polymyxa]MDN4115405.1 hypothetical protein [Paenibacillus polymyxa]
MTVTVQNRESYKFGEIVLSKTEPFTINDIINDLNSVGIRKELLEINIAMKKLKDNGIIVQWGSSYAVYR